MTLGPWLLTASLLLGCNAHTSAPTTTRNVKTTKAQSVAAPNASHTPAAAPTTPRRGTPDNARPDGWWTAAPNRATNQKRLYVRFDRDGYLVTVEGFRETDHGLCTWKSDNKGWHCVGVHSFRVDADPDGLALSYDDVTVHLTVAPKDLVASLEAGTKEVQPGPNICDQAEICCKEASALMGEVCDVNWQLAGKISARTCLQSMQGYTEILTMKKLTPPRSCVTRE